MDIKIPLVCVLIAGGAIGLALPAEDQADVAPTPAPVAAPTQSVPTTDTGWFESTTLERAGDGHFYAEVMVDGQSVLMLVDTGASVVALTGDDAAALGLNWFDSDVVVIGQGAGGPVEGVRVTLDTVAVGEHEAVNVQAVIIPEGAQLSLLGQSFLSTIASVEISGDQMVLEN